MTLTLLNNRYRILRTLGSGGFGETYLGEDSYMPSSRRCAIKQLKPATPDPQAYQIAQERFQREAAVLEDLGEHNGQIPQLYAYFSEAGNFYLVQEWIEGDTLAYKMHKEGVLQEAVVRDILVSLLPVLDYVHSKRIIHRDIKPENIILRGREPVLIDFGAVKEALGNTNHSIVIGTPGFMPAEQAAGQPVYSSDLYSLGLTAIYLLTGKTPPELERDRHTGTIIWQQYAPSISPALVSVLDKAIQPDPRLRFATAREMLAALQSGVALPPNANPSIAPTVAVAPAAGSPQRQIPVSAPVVAQERGINPLVVGALMAVGLIGATVAVGVIVSSNSPPDSEEVSSPPLVAEQPSSEPTPNDSPVDSDPIVSESPGEESAASPTPTPETSDTTASPQRDRAASPTPTSTPDSDTTQSALPASTRVPAFPVGTPRSTVEASLGKPAIDARGLWGTRAVVYRFEPKQIDLGYLFDRNTGLLRQTEASFAPSVNAEIQVNTLDKLLQGRIDDNIKQGLLGVHQRENNAFTFTQGSLQGQIVRQNCDFIYISIWEAELHDFNVASSREC